MAIRSDALLVHFNTRPEEKQLAEKLDEAFDISHGSRHGERSFWLADPKIHTKERFGLQQEVLVIYSPHTKTDARVLTAIENITRMPDYKHRVDRVLILLIHAGNHSETEDLIKQDADHVIVPFHTDELLSPTRGSIFIRSRIANYFGEIDLFGMSSPITSDRYFFGRDKLVQELVVRASTSLQNSGVFGLRKTGKTSVLRAIERRVSDSPIVTEYFDCSGTGIHSARWWQMLNIIIERFSSKLDVKKPSNYTIHDAGSRFSTDVQYLIKSKKLNQVIVMLDEIEFVTPQLSGALGRHWDEDFVPFWQSLRATHQELQGKLVFIVAGVNPACVTEPRFNNLPNPIFQLAMPQFLLPFSKEDLRAMVRTIGRYSGLHFEENVYDYLKSTYGGHPFLIRIACSEVWKDTDTSQPVERATVTVDDFQRLQKNIEARLEQPIKDILLSLVWWYPEEYELLQILAEGQEEFVTEYLKENPHSLLKFAQYGILRSGDTTDFAINDLKNFLKKFGNDYKNSLSPFVRADVPLEWLPQVPDLEALGQLFQKRIEIETKLRRTIIMYFGLNGNWDNEKISNNILKGLDKRPDRKDPKQIFIGNTPQKVINDLYLNDLKKIITASWDVFSPLFDANKTRFEMNMDTINSARNIETHTKPLTPAEIEDFRNSYTWTLRKLEKLPFL